MTAVSERSRQDKVAGACGLIQSLWSREERRRRRQVAEAKQLALGRLLEVAGVGMAKKESNPLE